MYEDTCMSTVSSANASRLKYRYPTPTLQLPELNINTQPCSCGSFGVNDTEASAAAGLTPNFPFLLPFLLDNLQHPSQPLISLHWVDSTPWGLCFNTAPLSLTNTPASGKEVNAGLIAPQEAAFPKVIFWCSPSCRQETRASLMALWNYKQ